MACIEKKERLRRRGPRSVLSRLRRQNNKQRSGGAPADVTSGEAEVNTSVIDSSYKSQPFLIYCINIRCLLSNHAELCYQVKVLTPHVILLQETWLNASIEEISIPGYRILSRRDRSVGENRGGIVSLARLDVPNIVCVEQSENAERAWYYLHFDIGSIAVCNWYRPGAAGDEPILSLQDELFRIRSDVLGIVVMGDCNVHHIRWPRYSNGTSADGSILKRICDDFGMKQLVDLPTRGPYLLDLVLTDLENCKVEVRMRLRIIRACSPR